jgi:hypothetical protein
MSKTRRRNIKKRNTRRKKSSLFYKNKTNSATRAYKNRNKQRKTKHRRSQRGGGIKLVGIDKETGENIFEYHLYLLLVKKLHLIKWLY